MKTTMRGVVGAVAVSLALEVGSVYGQVITLQTTSGKLLVGQLVPAAAVPESGTFYSLQNDWPPLPFDWMPGLPVYSLGGGKFLVEDSSVNYAQVQQSGTMSPMDDSGTNQPPLLNCGFDTNGLWLELTNAADGLAYLNLHNASDFVYEILGKTDLTASKIS